MDVNKRFTKESIDYLLNAIKDANDNEVLAVGKINKDGLVSDIYIAARGDDKSVIVPDGFIERGDVLIHNHPSGFLEPSQADMEMASIAGKNGVGSFIVNNSVTELYVVAEPVRAHALVALDPDLLASVLDTNGKLSEKLKDYEPRQSQIDLLKRITDAMNQGYVLAAEAGTGIGKSFAYLIPALAWAARNKERVVISTATINLQKQLIDKDVPKVLSIFKKQLKVVLVKGRGNYICINRLLETVQQEGLFSDVETHPLSKISAWVKNTKTGDRSDLSFHVEENLWARVRSEADDCLNMKCPHRTECFVLKVKRDAADADVLISNHHILFSDIAARKNGIGYEATAVLPPYTTIIFDEAHAIENSATSFFSEEINKFTIIKQLGKLYREYKNRKFGIVIKLQNIKTIKKSILKNFSKLCDDVIENAEEVNNIAIDLLQDETTYRFTENDNERQLKLLAALGKLEKNLMTCTQTIQDAIASIPNTTTNVDNVVHEAEMASMRLLAIAKSCMKFNDFFDDDSSVYWLNKQQANSGDMFATFCITPIDIGSILNEAMFECYRSIICVSATLAVAGKFNFWKSRVGLHYTSVRTETAIYHSPFNFDQNALLASPQDAILPDSNLWQDYINKVVYKLIKSSGGHALVLFTAYATLKSAWNYVYPLLAKLGISAFRQGDDDRTKLLDAFKSDVSSVLFATDSFWEGIDAPGETLQLVIITKLPFRVPTDPVQKARSEAIEQKGGSAFMDFSLPEAVIKFKQGFGRLIRHSNDKGSVVILDGRLTKKHYGKIFISSLPKTKTNFETLDSIIKDIKIFLKKKETNNDYLG